MDLIQSNKTFDTGDTGNTFQIQNNTINSYSGSGSTVILNNTPTISSLFVNSGLNLNGSTTGHTQLLAQSTASGTITFPAVTGTVVTTGDTGSVTNTMLAGSIANDKLSNSSVTASILFDDVAILSGVSVAANTSIFVDLKQVVDPSDTVKGSASTTAVNFHISGVEIV